MKSSKRIFSLLLVLALLFTMLPVPALATGSKPQTSVDTGDITIEGTNGFGTLLSQEIQESQEESATAEEGYEAGYSVIDLTFEGATATVEYSSLEEARLVVAVYSEDGLQMLASGETTVSPDVDVETVTIEGDMPEYFMASAYLVDTYDMSPLCAAYDTPMYTRDMQELLESTVDDYDPDRVLNLDEDETTNFAVYAEDTILIEPVDGFNIVTTVDDENGVYVIENADEQITSLRVGDVFSYAYGENEILIAKVTTITVDGTTATITSSDELEMDEVFSHVKIENAGDTDDLIIDESTVDEGLVYEGVETENGSIQPQAYDGSISHKTSLKYKIAYGDSKRGIEVSGSAKFSITLSLELYISWSYSRVEITLEPVVTFGAKIKSELASNGISLKMGQISLPFMYGAAKIKFTPKFVAEFSGSVGVEAKVSAKFGFYFETGKRGPKFQLIRISTCDGFELDAEVGLFAGLELTPEVEVLGGSVMEAKITGKIGVEATCSPNDRDTDKNADVRHNCVGCVDGDLSAVLSINASLKVLGKNALKKLASTDLSFVDWKAKFADFYLCFEHKDFGWGGCPCSEYRTTVYVKDSDENPLYNADVYVGDQKKQTDKNGIAVFYLKYGTHDISADYEELYAEKNVGVNKAQKVTLIARPDDYPSGASENIFGSIIPDDVVDNTPIIIDSGKCGDNVNWTLDNKGWLTISGTGPMDNFSYFTDVPWYNNRSSIISATIENGVTTISDYSFCDCEKLEGVWIGDSVASIDIDFTFSGCTRLTGFYVDRNNQYYSEDNRGVLFDKEKRTLILAPGAISGMYWIPNGVTTIGESAFFNCEDLTYVTIPNSVTTIGPSAFQVCFGLTSMEIPDSVNTIDRYAFCGCNSLTSVTIPDSVTAIGHNAFMDCDSLTSVTIPDSVTNIGGLTFAYCDGLTDVTIGAGVTGMSSAFYSCTSLSDIVFRGNAPYYTDEAFSGVVATAYYPAGNSTWTAGVMDGFGGTITWVPYTLDGNGNMVTNNATAVTVTEERIEIDVPMLQTDLQLPKPDFGGEEAPLAPNAVYDGEYSTVDTGTYIVKTASFSGLVPGEQYVLLSMVSIDVENPLAADNLLYIDQAAALEDGTLVFQYVQRTPTDTSYVVACGASNKNLNDAQITFPEMVADGETLVVNPTVVYDGQTLTEGQDYTIQGTVSVTEPGTYTCYIRGIRNYSGLVECTYAVIAPYNEVAYGFCGDNMTWTFYDNGRLTISGMGEMTAFDSNSSVPWNDRRSSILAVIIEEGVTTISDFAFAECANLTSVKIGDSVTTIGDLAFSECTSLTSVKIPDSVTTIGSYVFQDCTSLSKVAIGDSLTEISSGAFQYCSSLESVTIGESVATIGYGAFQSCSSLKNITLPNSMVNIGNAAFKSCTGLTSVKLGESVTTIGSSAFSGCTSLTTVEIPESVTTIGDSAFGFCNNLTGIYVDERNPNYSNDDCGVLFDKEKNELIQAPGGISGYYKIPDSVSTISNDAFNYCTRLSSVEIPSSVTTIEYSAFESCTGMTSAVIPYGVIRIGNEAFKSCTSLTSVSIPDSVTHIGNEAFSSCTNLTSVLIGKSVDAIGNYAFRSCINLIAIHVDDNNPNYSNDDWGVLFDKEKVELIQAPAALSGSYELSDSVTTIGSYAFRSCVGLTSLIIPQSVDTIGNYAFSSCIGLSQITFMGDAPIINVGAFSGVTSTACYPATNPTWSEDILQNYGGTITWTPFCTEHSYEVVVTSPTCTEQGYTTHTCLKCGDSYITDETEALGHTYESVDTENGLLTYTCTVCGDSYTEVLPDAFLYSTYADHVEITGYTGNESELVIPSEIEGLPVTTIGVYAFYDCDTLISITIPGNVRYLDSNAFGKCSNLTTINFDGDAPTFASDAFNSVNADAYYYEKHHGWIPEVMMSYGGHIIWHALDASILRNLDYYVYEDHVEITGVSRGITELAIPDQIDGLPVTIIGDEAFKYHDQLTNVTLPDSVTYIGDCAFENCSNLTSINIPDSVTYIGKYAFKQCGNLSSSINIPNGITHIGDYAFYLCSSITGNVTIPVSPTTMGNGVYEFCSSLTGVTIQDGVTAIPDGTFWGCDGLTSIILPDTVTTIGAYAFSSCDGVTSIDIPASVTHIGDDAFFGCSRLKTIRFLGDAPEFGEDVFLSVYGKAYYPGSNPTWTTEVMENCEDYSISWVAEGEVFGMEIVSTPESGFVGQEPDLSDLSVELFYGNNIHRPIDNWYLTISEIDTTVAGKKNVTISYGDFFDEFTFFVHETESGIVLDPSLYPESEHNYGNNLVENKALTWPGTIGLVLVFSEKTFVEDGCDWITVLDGKGNQLATFSGSEAAGVTLVVPGDTVKILLNSDYSNTGYGYSFDSITTLNTHHTGATIVPSVEPTCTEPGHTEGIICEICDQPQYTAIPALGHDLGEWETVTEASCTEKGVEQQQCSRCDHAEIRFYKAFGHVWDTGVVTIEPTEDTEGERLYTCTTCGATKTEPIPVIGHEHSYEAVVTAPTCTEQGYTTYTCRCGESYTADYVNALGHDMGEWRTVTGATCTEEGVEQCNCFRCDYIESRTIEAVGHRWDKGVVTREPTEDTEGERLYTCTACGITKTESIPVIGHEHSYEAVVTAPTCTEQGYTTYTCSCGESYTADYVDVLGHAWSDWVVIQESTTTEEGIEEHTCTRCGHIEQRSVAKLENSFSDVAPGSFYYEPVMWAIENGITNGTSATTFSPNDQCMRAHVVTFLWRAVGCPEPTKTDNPFVDVKPADFYYKPVLWAVENGITSGMDATHFGPTAYCNRAQVVTFLYRTVGSPAVDASQNPFIDISAGQWFTAPVLWAVENGITNGLSATTFGPNTICNRAQIVTFLYRAFVNE